MSGARTPLVTIGIPTHNRCELLERAASSVLAQGWPNLELVISDNASTDGTREYGEELARTDPRVRYERRPVNVGPSANFNGLVGLARGEFFGFLADDDWLDSGYVAARVAVLMEDERAVLSCGPTLYVRDGAVVAEGVAVNAVEASAPGRVAAYLRTVDDNGTVYGLTRTARLRQLPAMPNVMGGDWLLVAGLAAVGHIRTLPTAPLYRSLTGNSTSMSGICRALALPRTQAAFPYAYIGAALAADLLGDSPAYRSLTRTEKVRVLLAVAPSLVRRQLWHVALSATARVRHLRIARIVIDALPSGLRYPGHATHAVAVPDEAPSSAPDRRSDPGL